MFDRGFRSPLTPSPRSGRWCAALLLFCWLPPAAAGQPPDVPRTLGLLDAVELTLANDPLLVQAAARVDSASGSLLAESGAFDPVVSSSVDQETAQAPVASGQASELRTLSTGVGVSRRLRTGLTVAPEVGVLRTDEPGAAVSNLGTLAVTLRQPLLRGRGREVVTAGERFAEREVAASRLDLEQTTAVRVLTVVAQYWLLEAAARNVEILRETEDRARDLLETTRRLVEADQTPAAELVQVEANLAAKEAARIGGERELFAARQDLGREIGLDGGRIAALPLPADPFPVVQAADVPAPESARFAAEARARRADLRAARERLSGTDILTRSAGDTLKPQLDLILVPSYSGLVQGTGTGDFFSPLYRNVPGLSSSVGLALSWPTANRRGRGELLRAQAIRRQAAAEVEAFEKAIAADVPAALDAVANAALQVEKAAAAVALFERAVINEEKKLRAGSSTLLDLISQRDRLTSARQTQVSAQLSLAIALAELRFQTGTLLPEGNEPAAARYARLTTVPAVAGEGAP